MKENNFLKQEDNSYLGIIRKSERYKILSENSGYKVSTIKSKFAELNMSIANLEDFKKGLEFNKLAKKEKTSID